MALVAKVLGVDEPLLAIEPVPAQDWLTRSYQSFPPIRAGRFFVYGSHYEEAVPPASLGLLIDAATAFGSGEHATTWGCLVALDRLARRFPVRVARINVRRNQVTDRVRTVGGNGYRAAAVRDGHPYDLIAANILARPLARMAPDLRRHLRRGGYAVLSGLLARQENQVLSAHRTQGLRLVGRIPVGEWRTLVLRG
jgi:ribosomal protein L11 methyltransferase